MVLDQSHLDSFSQPRPFIAIAQCLEKCNVIPHRFGGCKAAEIIFFMEIIDAVFDTDARVILGQHGSGNSDVPDSTVRYGRGITHSVEKSTSTDGCHVRVPIDAMTIDSLKNILLNVPIIFDQFSSWENINFIDQTYMGNTGKIGFYPGDKIRMMV